MRVLKISLNHKITLKIGYYGAQGQFGHKPEMRPRTGNPTSDSDSATPKGLRTDKS